MEDGLRFEGRPATHPHAMIVWPFLSPLYEEVRSTAFELRDFAPIPARLNSMAGVLRDLILEAELRLLGAPPERYVARLLQVL